MKVDNFKGACEWGKGNQQEIAEEDLCLLLNPKRFFVRGRKLDYILDCLIEPERYEAFIEHSVFYPEDLHEFHLTIAAAIHKFKTANQNNLSPEFVAENLPNLLFVLSKTIHYRIPQDIRPLLNMLAEFANVHDWVNDIPSLKKLAQLLGEYTDYMELFFDGVKKRVSKGLFPIYQKMEVQEFKEGLMNHMIGKTNKETDRLELQIQFSELILEKDTRSAYFITRSIAKRLMQLIRDSQENTFIDGLKHKRDLQEKEIAKLNNDIKSCEDFKQRCQQQIYQLTVEKNGLQTQNNEILAELQESRLRVEQLFAELQEMAEQVAMVAEPQLLSIRTIGSSGSNGLFEYDGQQLRRALTLGFSINYYPECVTLEDGSLFVCGGYNSDNTCIITPDNQVRQIAKMNKLRHLSAIVKVDKRIYVFGGNGTGTGLEAEYYDINQNKWTNIQSLPNIRSNCGAAYYNGKIYVGGGYCGNDSSKHRQILRYNINSNTYTPTNMNAVSNNQYNSLFIVDNTLYSVGAAQIVSYNIETEQTLATVSTLYYNWWSCMPPLVLGDEVILVLTCNINQFVRLNYKTGNATNYVENGNQSYCNLQLYQSLLQFRNTNYSVMQLSNCISIGAIIYFYFKKLQQRLNIKTLVFQINFKESKPIKIPPIYPSILETRIYSIQIPIKIFY